LWASALVFVGASAPGGLHLGASALAVESVDYLT